MKYTLATLALVSSAEACGDHYNDHGKTMKHHFTDHAKKFLGLIPKHEICTSQQQEEGSMDSYFKFYRTLKATAYNEFLKGYYNSHMEVPAGDKCFGAWMDADVEMFHNIFQKFKHGDWWNISHDELKHAHSEALNLFLDTVDDCQYYRVIYDSYNWCMENGTDCLRQPNFINRIESNIIPLAGDIWSSWSTVTSNDLCFDDETYIEEFGTLAKNAGSFGRTWHGFTGKWNPDAEIPHLSGHEMHENIHNLNKQLPKGECPVLKFVRETFGIDLHHHHHQFAKIGAWNPFNMLMPKGHPEIPHHIPQMPKLEMPFFSQMKMPFFPQMKMPNLGGLF
jgi:hypothetical protein